MSTHEDNISTLASPQLPARTLVETSLAVREASKSLSKILIDWPRPKTTLIVTKPDLSLITVTRQVAFLLLEKSLDVYIERKILNHQDFKLKSATSEQQTKLHEWSEDFCHRNAKDIDFVITLGGDGTVLYASWLFQKMVPPLLAFNLGSLGFLTIFDYHNVRETVDKIMQGPLKVNLRMRLDCRVYKYGDYWERRQALKSLISDPTTQRNETASYKVCNDVTGTCQMMPPPENTTLLHNAIESSKSTATLDDVYPTTANLLRCLSSPIGLSSDKNRRSPHETFQVLNEIAVDRGPSPYMSQLEIFESVSAIVESPYLIY